MRMVAAASHEESGMRSRIEVTVGGATIRDKGDLVRYGEGRGAGTDLGYGYC